MKLILSLLLLSSISSTVSAQVIGDFTLTDLRNSREVSLNKYSNKSAIIVLFTSRNCPYDEYYKDRMTALVSDYSDKDVEILFINSVPGEMDDQLAQSVRNYNAPYLTDKQQVVMKLLGASKTPESIILIPVNGGFRKIYQGAIDNNPQVESDVKKPYLRKNLDDILSGKPLTYADVLPVGCRIRTP